MEEKVFYQVVGKAAVDAVWLMKGIAQTQKEILKDVQKIMATQSEEAAKLQAIGDQLDKATAEIVAAVQQLKDALAAAGNTTPEVDTATDRLSKAAQALDDLNPDQPTAAPAQP